jgi:hypothetical protein
MGNGSEMWRDQAASLTAIENESGHIMLCVPPGQSYCVDSISIALGNGQTLGRTGSYDNVPQLLVSTLRRSW